MGSRLRMEYAYRCATQADLAALVGASRVSVNQALGQFRKRELVSIGKDGRVSLRDEEALVRRTR